LLGLDELLGLEGLECVECFFEKLLFHRGALFPIFDLTLNVPTARGDLLVGSLGLFHLLQLSFELLETDFLPLLKLFANQFEFMSRRLLEL
jgi:hypothetical protein